MKIGIVGAGKMGAKLGELWAKAGHQVMFGSRDSEKARLQAANFENIEGGSMVDAADFGSVVVLGVPGDVVVETVSGLGCLQNKVLIDISNRLGKGVAFGGVARSNAEAIADVAKGAHVIKAFNGIHYKILDTPIFNNFRADVYYCGDDPQAKAIVGRLIRDIGFEPVDCGSLANAGLLEAMAVLWINLAFLQGDGTDFTLKLLRR